jgi:hypothetical protein
MRTWNQIEESYWRLGKTCKIIKFRDLIKLLKSLIDLHLKSIWPNLKELIKFKNLIKLLKGLIDLIKDLNEEKLSLKT